MPVLLVLPKLFTGTVESSANLFCDSPPPPYIFKELILPSWGEGKASLWFFSLADEAAAGAERADSGFELHSTAGKNATKRHRVSQRNRL